MCGEICNCKNDFIANLLLIGKRTTCGNVATLSMCGEICKNDFIANLLLIGKRTLKIAQDYCDIFLRHSIEPIQSGDDADTP